MQAIEISLAMNQVADGGGVTLTIVWLSIDSKHATARPTHSQFHNLKFNRLTSLSYVHPNFRRRFSIVNLPVGCYAEQLSS